jgi:3-methyladenine DNA glycosylase AlkD
VGQGRTWARLPPDGLAGDSPAECGGPDRRCHPVYAPPLTALPPVRPASVRPVTDRPDRALVDAARAALQAIADPVAAEPMRAYMKSSMPFLGVPTPARTAALRPLLAAHPLTDPATWRGTVRALFREATYREERYAALAVARRYPTHLAAEPARSLDLLDEIVVTGAWWDLVDDTAIRLVGPLLQRHPEAVRPAVRRWAGDADRWRRRAAVICQIGAKERTDTALLAEAIEANLADPDFFLRKGIGWALRQHARLDPDWVRTFAETHELSPLSRREALKHL